MTAPSASSGGASWLLVCLGNPGDQYENTRHNVGFMVADELAERQRVPIQRLRFKALTNLLTISGEKVLVMKPVTYMNLSGEAVRQAAVRDGALMKRIAKGAEALCEIFGDVLRKEATCSDVGISTYKRTTC